MEDPAGEIGSSIIESLNRRDLDRVSLVWCENGGDADENKTEKIGLFMEVVKHLDDLLSMKNGIFLGVVIKSGKPRLILIILFPCSSFVSVLTGSVC